MPRIGLRVVPHVNTRSSPLSFIPALFRHLVIICGSVYREQQHTHTYTPAPKAPMWRLMRELELEVGAHGQLCPGPREPGGISTLMWGEEREVAASTGVTAQSLQPTNNETASWGQVCTCVCSHAPACPTGSLTGSLPSLWVRVWLSPISLIHTLTGPDWFELELLARAAWTPAHEHRSSAVGPVSGPLASQAVPQPSGHRWEIRWTFGLPVSRGAVGSWCHICGLAGSRGQDGGREVTFWAFKVPSVFLAACISERPWSSWGGLPEETPGMD